MAQETIGTYQGQNYFVGSNDPAPIRTPVAAPAQPVAAPIVPVTTSDPARNNYSLIEDAINKLFKTQPAVPNTASNVTSSATQSLLEQRRIALDERRKAEVERLGKEFDSAAVSQKQGQKSETGTSSMGLARLGGFDSASGQAVLTNLQRVHEGEQQDLLNKRQAAITLAQNAYEDKDFDLAQLQLRDAKDAEQLIYDRQKDFINISLQLKGEQRADLNSQLQQAQFEYQKQRDDKKDAQSALDFSIQYGIDKPFFIVGGIGHDTSTGEKLSYDEFIARGGKEDFSNATIITPGSLEDKAYVKNLRADYPDAGITPGDTAESALAKLNNSRLYRKQTYIAPVGGLSGAKTSAQAKIIQDAKAVLDAQAAASKDGKANPRDYREFLSKYIQADGNVNDFYGAVSLDTYISEANRKGDLAGTSIQYQQLKNGGMTQEEKNARLQELAAKIEDGSASLAELQEWKSLQ